MRYIFHDIWLLVRNKTLIYLITVISVMASVFLLHFSYSLFQSSMKQKESEVLGRKEINISVKDQYEIYDENEVNGSYKVKECQGESYATVKDVKTMLKALPEDFFDDLESVSLSAVVDNVPLYFLFSIQNQKYTICEIQKKNMSDFGLLTDGRYFSRSEYETGEKVALIYEASKNENAEFSDSILSDDKKYITLQGEQYKVIGKQQLFGDQPMVPVTAIHNDSKIYGNIHFYFYNQINSVQYEELKEMVDLYLDPHGVLDKVHLPDQDKIYLYNTMMVIAVLIALISSLNFVILYQYLLESRKKETKAFLICGQKKWQAVLVNVTECAILTIPVYVMTAILYDHVFLKIIRAFYPYIDDHYSIKLYASLFAIYYFCSLFVLICSLLCSMRNTDLDIRGGRRK